MSRHLTHVIVTAALLVATSCGETSDAGGPASGSTTSSTSTSGAMAGGSTTSATTSGAGSTSVGGAGGEGAGGDASGGSAPSSTSSGGAGGEGGQGGQPPVGPTPAECFELHDEEECYAAGCDRYLFHPEDFTIVDGVCHSDDSVGYCFREDPDGSGSASALAFVRDFEAEGADVLGFAGQPAFLGWLRCDENLAEIHRECCCWNLNVPQCFDIVPVPHE